VNVEWIPKVTFPVTSNVTFEKFNGDDTPYEELSSVLALPVWPEVRI
jgi:hypothetical protein